MTHWTNPWIEAIPVPAEELAQALAGGTIVVGDRKFAMTASFLLGSWLGNGNKIDAYILPGKSLGFYSVGVRYGDGGGDYLSPYAGDRTEKIEALLAKYTPAREPDAEERLTKLSPIVRALARQAAREDHESQGKKATPT